MMLLVEIAVNNAKFHSSQGRTNQSTATNVSQSINHKTEEVDLVEEAQVVEDLEAEVAAEVVLAEEVDLTEDHEKCTRQLVEIVVRNAKFHLNQNKTSQSTAANVFKVIKETRKYTRIMDKTNPIRRYYVVPIVIIIVSILVFLGFKW